MSAAPPALWAVDTLPACASANPGAMFDHAPRTSRRLRSPCRRRALIGNRRVDRAPSHARLVRASRAHRIGARWTDQARQVELADEERAPLRIGGGAVGVVEHLGVTVLPAVRRELGDKSC